MNENGSHNFVGLTTSWQCRELKCSTICRFIGNACTGHAQVAEGFWQSIMILFWGCDYLTHGCGNSFFSHFVCCTKHSIVVYVMKCAIPLKPFSCLCKCKICSNASDFATMSKRETKKCKTVIEFQKESFSQNCILCLLWDFGPATVGLREQKKCNQRM